MKETDIPAPIRWLGHAALYFIVEPILFLALVLALVAAARLVVGGIDFLFTGEWEPLWPWSGGPRC